MSTTPKPPTAARIVSHGIESSSYFQGHGTSFTQYTDCATGIGSSERAAYDDALEQLAMDGQWDVDALEKMLEGEAESLSARDDVHDECADEDHDECELHYWVSVDVA